MFTYCITLAHPEGGLTTTDSPAEANILIRMGWRLVRSTGKRITLN